MDDITAILIGLLGILGALLGSAFTFYYTQLRRSQEMAQNVAFFGVQVLATFQDLLEHVAKHEQELRPIYSESWESSTPSNKAELNSVLDKALAAFPLPLPELFVPPPNELTEPYSVLLRLNLRDTQEWIEDLNKKAGEMANPENRTTERVSEFMGRAQLFIKPQFVEQAAVTVYGNVLDSVWYARGDILKEGKKRKEQEKMRKGIREDLQHELDVWKAVQSETALFEARIAKMDAQTG